MEFSGQEASAKDRRERRDNNGNDRAAQVAFETNSSIGSENCSIDSIQVMESIPTSQAKSGTQQQGRSSFWRYFFKSKPTNPHPSKHLQFVEAAQTEDMHTI